MKSTSKKFALNYVDIIKGCIIAILTPCVVIIQASLDAGIWIFNWKQIAMAAVGGFIAYIAKNFLSDSQPKNEGK
jgi:hypothetical protein